MKIPAYLIPKNNDTLFDAEVCCFTSISSELFLSISLEISTKSASYIKKKIKYIHDFVLF